MRLSSFVLLAIFLCVGRVADAAESEFLQFESSLKVSARGWEKRVKEGRGSATALALNSDAIAKPSVEGFKACIARSIKDKDVLGEAVCSLGVLESIRWKEMDFEWARGRAGRASELFQQELGPKSSARARALWHVADYAGHTDAAAAIAGYEQALEIQEEVLHVGHSETMSTIARLQSRFENDPVRAERLLTRALARHEREPLPDDQQIVTWRLALANLRNDRGDVDGALALCSSAVVMARDSEGAHSLLVSNALAVTGTILRKEGRWEEAILVLEPAFRIQRASLKSDKGMLGTTASQLAFAYQGAKAYEDAFRYLAIALAIHEQAYAADSPMIAQSFDNLAVLELERGRAAESVTHAARAVAVREKNDNPRRLARSLDQLAFSQHAAGSHAAAKATCRRALDVVRKVADDSPPCAAQLDLDE